MTKTQFLVVRCQCGNAFVSGRTVPLSCPDRITVDVQACDDCNDDCWEVLYDSWMEATEQALAPVE